ncbi:hypothetical protein SUGI_0588190 [Cryptomeria japonica]|uniref:uncharacterized protein LOC131064187 n=1 Tax=Cryptomeria japonica TaxID=3369 RepID=UPI002414A39F|nr:uncharacterized protein LOC131064187 [Cryptomeria japonica]XP_057854209.2 uncharacterized protein LOC131064187 [Cryptomeria japonica]GLJ29785.1 hypothetical protein SUGI_0588190 [Cryptomeria japonica]
MIVLKQHDVEGKTKDIEAYRHGLCWTIRDGKRLVDNKMETGDTKCQHFSIRGYVARTREVNGNICWPFPQHLLETRSKEEVNAALPSIEVPQYKWWNCRKCLDGINTSEILVEKTSTKNFCDSSLTCDGNCDPGRQIFGIQVATPNANLQEKCRENTLNDTKMAESATVDLKSNSVLSLSVHENEKDKIDRRLVTEETVEHCWNEGIAPLNLQEGKFETPNAKEEKISRAQCLSKSIGKADMSGKHCHNKHDRKKTCADMGQSVTQPVSSSLISEMDDVFVSKESKSNAFQNACHSSNSWEFFSRNKNIFEQISKKVRETGTMPATSQLLSLGSETCDADHPRVKTNKLENIGTAPPVSLSSDKNVQPGQQTLTYENNKEAISEEEIKSLTVQTVESSVKERDPSLGATDEENDVPHTSKIGISGIEDSDRSNITEGKECVDLPMNQGSVDKCNVLLAKENENLKVSESRSKKKSQKKRSIADIIASDSMALDICNKEKEESKLVDTVVENICGPGYHDQSLVPVDSMIAPKDAAKTSPKSQVETTSKAEVNLDADINNVKRKKRQPENFKMKKKQGKRAQSLDGSSSFALKDSSNARKFEAISNIIQMPQGASDLVQMAGDKLHQDNSIHHVDGQMNQRCSEVDDDVPMDVIELMAKNQSERDLSECLSKKHKSKKDDRRVKIKVKESDVSHANKPTQKERTNSKKKAARHKSLAESKKTDQVSPQVYLRTLMSSNMPGVDNQINVSQMISTGQSSFSDTEAIKSDSLKEHSETLQSSQWFNPWGKHSNFIVPFFNGTNVTCNSPTSFVDCLNSKVAISQEGTLCTNGMSPAFLQVPMAAARDGEHMQMKTLYNKDTSVPLECRKPVVLKFHEDSESSRHSTVVSSAMDSSQNITQTVMPIPTSGNSNLDSGPKCNIPFQNHKGKDISVPSGKREVISFPAYFVGQSNSALLQQVNAQARPIFGNNYPVSVPSVPVLRLMGQSVSVPGNSGIDQNNIPENKNNGTFSELLHASSQKHVPWFHPITCASTGASCENRMFKNPVPIQDSMCVKQQTQSSKTPIPPVPKFSHVCLVSNGHPGAASSSCTVPDKADVAMELPIANKQIPFQDASLFMMQQKNGLNCANGYNGNLQNFSTIPPPMSQTTESVKGPSPTKGPRSYRRPPTNVHLNRNHTAAADVYSQNRHHLQALSISGTNLKQRRAEESMKAKKSSLKKGNRESAFVSKRSCNIEICTLNQNPAEIIIDDGEIMDGLSYKHLPSPSKALLPSKGKRNSQVPNGEKKRRALKTKYLQEFIGYENGHTSDLANRNVGTALPKN